MDNWVLEDDMCHKNTADHSATLFAASGDTQISYHVGSSTRGNLACVQTEPTEYRLSKHSSTSSDNGLEAVIDLHQRDLDKIKAVLTLGVSTSSSFLAATIDTIEDMVGNELTVQSDTAVCPSSCDGIDGCVCPVATVLEVCVTCVIDSVEVELWEADKTDIELLNFTLNVNEGTLRLYFSETLLLVSMDANYLTLQSDEEKGGDTESVKLSGGTYSAQSNTEATILLKKDDLDAIKARYGLGTGEDDTFVVISPLFATDTRSNGVKEIFENEALAAKRVYGDENKPKLVSFTFNVNEGILRLYFSESINVDTVNPRAFVFQTGSDLDDADVWGAAFNDGTVSATSDPTIVEIKITNSDLNKIKIRSPTASTSYLSMDEAASEVAAKDTAGNDIELIYPQGAQLANLFVEDTTSPKLTHFDLDMDAGEIFFFFTETVNTDSFEISTLFLASTDGNGATTSSALEGETVNTGDYHVVYVELSRDTLNEIKLLPDLGTSTDNTFVSTLADGATVVLDMNNRILQDFDPAVFPVRNHTEDLKAPEMTGFTLNMHALKLTVSFTETVNTGTLNINLFTISSADGSSSVGLTSASSTSLSEVGDVVVITIGTVDANKIKHLTELATDEIDTYLALGKAAIKDMNSNPNAEAAAKATNLHTEDLKKPYLDEFDLNMDAATLTLSFSETIDGSSFESSAITLIAPDGERLTLSTGGTRTGPSLGTSVYRTAIDEDDLNKLKAKLTLCTGDDDCLISITTALMTDMNGNAVQEVGLDNAVEVQTYTKDKTNPTLLSASLISLDEYGSPPVYLLLDFSETVVDSINALDVGGVTLQDTKDGSGSNSVQLTTGDVMYTAYSDSTQVRIKISDTDVELIKGKVPLGTSVGTSFVVLAGSAISDVAGNFVDVVESTDAQDVTLHADSGSVFPDIIPPYMVSFDFDLSLERITLVFSEDVVLDTFTVTDLRIQTVANIDEATGSGDDTVAITSCMQTNCPQWNSCMLDTTGCAADVLGSMEGEEEPTPAEVAAWTPAAQVVFIYCYKQLCADSADDAGSGDSSDDSSTTYQLTTGAKSYDGDYKNRIIVQLDQDTVDDIKTLAGLAIDKDTTYLSTPNDFVYDFATNGADMRSLNVDTYTKDIIQPTLTDFSLNMVTGEMKLTFNEIVDQTTVSASHMLLQAAKDSDAAVSLPLVGETQLTTDNELTVTIMLDLDSANGIRADVNLAISEGTTFLTVTGGLIKDVDENEVNQIFSSDALPVGGFVVDSVPPELNGFKIDMLAGIIVLSFEQPVLGISTTFVELQLQGPGASPNVYSLTTGEYSSDVSTTVTITINEDDLNQIKSRDLCTRTLAEEGCFVSFSNSFIQDARGLPVPGVTEGAAFRADSYTDDDKSPSLLESTGFKKFDLDSGEIMLTFSEAIDPGSYKFAKITLVSDQEDAEAQSLTLTLVGDGIQDREVIATGLDSTVLTIKMAANDLNTIKQNTNLCVRRQDCYIKVDEGAFTDFAGNDLEATPTDDNLRTRRFAFDVSDPVLEDFTINMDSSYVTLTFDEAISMPSLIRSRLTFTNSNTLEHTLAGCPQGETCISQTDVYGFEFKVDITSDDLNQIKLIQFCTSEDDCFLTTTTELVKDMSKNSVVAVTNKQVVDGGYTEDITAPKLVKFTFDFNSEELVLTFNEPVKATDMTTTDVTLQGSKTSADNSIKLATAEVENVVNAALIVTINLVPTDLENLQRDTGLFISKDNSFLSIPRGAATDMAGIDLVAILVSDALQASTLGEDTLQGKLQEYTLDLATRKILLTFDEVIDISTFSATSIYVQNAVQVCNPQDPSDCDGTKSKHQLTTSTADGTGLSSTVAISLSRADHITLGEDTAVATSTDNTYLVLGASTFDDSLGRDIISTTDGKALKAFAIVDDKTKPTVVSSSIDLTAEEATIVFSEPVFKGTFTIGAITVQSDSGKLADVEYWTLTSTAYEFNKDRDTATIDLTTYDLDAIKARASLVIDDESAFISTTTDLVDDFGNNEPLAVIAESAATVTTVDLDITAPKVDSFKIDMDRGEIRLSFSEVVPANQVLPKQLTLQDATTATTHHTLTGGTASALVDEYDYTSADYSREILVKMTVHDLNIIKGKAMASEDIDTYIRLTQDAAEDMNTNAVDEIADGFAIKAAKYTADLTKPTLMTYELDMDDGKLTLTFSETIVYDEVNFDEITFHNEGETQDYSLTGGSIQGPDYTVLVVQMIAADMDAIKSRDENAVSATSTFISLTALSFKDVSGNPLVPVTKQDTSVYTGDTTDVKLESFELDIDTGYVTMSFSETVLMSTLTTSEITLVDATGKDCNDGSGENPDERFGTPDFECYGGVTFNMTPQSDYTSLSHTKLKFKILETDLNSIKRDTGLCISEATCWIGITVYAIEDMATNNVEYVHLADPMRVSPGGLTLDIGDPSVESYSLDMDDGVIVLGISEPVGIGQVATTGLSIKSESGAAGYTLTSSSTATLDEKQLKITIAISDYDLDQMKANVDIATSASDSVLVVDDSFAKDTAMNLITAVDHSETVTPDPFEADATPIEIVSAQIDLGTGILRIQGSEAVDLLKLIWAYLKFISGAATSGGRNRRSIDRYRRASEGVVLSEVGSTASIDPDDPTMLIIQLGALTINGIKSDPTLCTTPFNCFLVFLPNFITGFDGLPSVEVPAFSPLGNIVVLPDEVRPTLSSFSLDMNAMTVSLSFDESVDASTFKKSTLTIMNTATRVGADAVTLALAGSAAVYPAPGTVSEADLAIVIVYLDSNDANSIKALTSLGTDLDNTYLSFSEGTVKDMSGNAIDPPSIAPKAREVTEDATPPALHGGTLNMNSGTLTLTFDETVNSETLVADSIAIQGAETDGTNSILLTTSGKRQDFVEISIKIQKIDLDDLKQNTGVATGADTSFLTIAAGAIKDMSGNGIESTNEPSSSAFNLLGFVEDTTNPTLKSFYLNMTSGELRLVFSETVDVDTLAVDKITLQCSDSSP